MTTPNPLSARQLYNAAVIDDARELARRLLDPSVAGDDLADLMEHAVDKTDRAHAVIFYLICAARGIDPGSGVEVANTPERGALIIMEGS